MICDPPTKRMNTSSWVGILSRARMILKRLVLANVKMQKMQMASVLCTPTADLAEPYGRAKDGKRHTGE